MFKVSREVGVCSFYEILIIILIISVVILFLISNSRIFLCDVLFVTN